MRRPSKKRSEVLRGNKRGLKIKDPDVRQEAYKEFCKWLAQGKSINSFTFEKGELKCVGKTVLSYMEQYPTEFPPINKEFAFCKGYAVWEDIAEKSATGENQKANTASLQMVMRNKFKWDAKTPATESQEEGDLGNAIREVSSQPRIQANHRPMVASKQSVLDKGQPRQSYQVQSELGAEGAMERSASMQDSSESQAVGHNNVFLPPFP